MSRFVVVLAYAVVGVAWILFSDGIVTAILPVQLQETAQHLKGAGFVALTAVALWVMLLVRDRQLGRDRAELGASEERYRMLAERALDVVYRYRYVPTPGFEYVSPSVTEMTGYTPEDHYANPNLGSELVVPEDLPRLQAYAASGGDEPMIVRWRARDGRVLWTEHRVTQLRDDAGNVVAIEGTARDISGRVEAEDHHRLLTEAIEATPVGVAVMAGPERGFEITYVNRAMSRITGVGAERLVGQSAFAFARSGGPALTATLAERLAAGEPFEVDSVGPGTDGERPVTVLMSPIRGVDGAIESIVSVVVDRTDAVGRSVAESRLDAVMAANPLAMVTTDLDGHVQAWNPAAEALFGWTEAEAKGLVLPYLDESGWEGTAARREALLAGNADTHLERTYVRKDGTTVPCSTTAGVIRDALGHAVGYVTLTEDLTIQRASEDWNAQLRRAIDHAAEAVVITDTSGTIRYVNPAFEQVSGYRADELVGHNPRVLKSGLTPAKTYAELWGSLHAGEPWRGVLVNRRKDGSLYEEEATLSPVLSATGEAIAYVGVKRDLTLERRLASGLSSELNDRAAVQEAMARIEIHGSPEETAQGICDVLTDFDAIEEAMVVHVPPGDGPMVPIGAVHGARNPMRTGEPLPADYAAYLRTRAAEGPWAHSQLDRMPDSVPGASDLPPTTVAAPIRWRGRSVGILFASADTATPDAWIARHLRVIAEIATHVGPLLGPLLEAREATSVSQHQVRQVLAERAFNPVFQPVCDLASRAPIGWEALTRFDDACLPATRFAEAHRVGLGETLELECGELAAHTFARLTLPGWLSVNLSPSVVIAGRAQRILAAAAGPVVLELTEHVPIEDYDRLRAAIDLLEPPVMVAVDDAGAGYASLRHVLELRPDFVKLDLAFVHAIDRDPARQAMVAGMVHYASETNTQLIAEGVETEAERRTLLRLGVRYGQGYLLGMPSPKGRATDGISAAAISTTDRAAASTPERAAAVAGGAAPGSGVSADRVAQPAAFAGSPEPVQRAAVRAARARSTRVRPEG